MLDGYHILTFTHRDVSLETLGQLVVRTDAPEFTLRQLRDELGWEELMYLGTCNRVLFLYYQSGPDNPAAAFQLVQNIRPDLTEAEQLQLAQSLRVLHGTDAIRHFVEVAASMDSLVVGEREIIRQIRDAYNKSRDWQLCSDHLRLLMRYTVETAKYIYSNTGIGEKALSIVALAFQKLQQAGIQKNDRILLVGAGQTNALVAKFLDKYGYRNATVFNRSLDKAEAIATFLDGKALPLDAIDHYSEGFDVLIVCTGSVEPIITPQRYAQLLAGEQDSKILVDLAVPNNVEATVPDIFPVNYIHVEGLRHIAEENLSHREIEREKAAELITQSLFQFRHMWHERQVERSLSHIPQEVAEVKHRAVNEVFGKEFAQLDSEAQELVLRMLGYMEKKCIAIPMKTVKNIALHSARNVASSVSE
jgi:glutamyl-tRNA reductase